METREQMWGWKAWGEWGTHERPLSSWVLTQELLEELAPFPLAPGHFAQKMIVIST